jgi:uncharacterized coiled-coil protein SlyX
MDVLDSQFLQNNNERKKHMKTITNIIYPAFAVFALACFVFVHNAQAVSPAPDGGYPGGNTAEGASALFSLTTGGYNTAVGYYSLRSNTTGAFNTGIGAGTLLANTGDKNAATGAGALLSNTTGSRSTANGAFALFSNTTGGFNTANGEGALYSNTTGFENTANGFEALYFNNGNGNTAYGFAALSGNTTGSSNIALGVGAGSNVTNASNVIAIGNVGANASDTCFIGNIYTTVQPVVGTDPDNVTVNSLGRLGRANVSSRRYKHDIKLMDKASEALFKLKPVSFRYKKEFDSTQTLAFGLIAEQVAEVYPDLVGRNAEGQPESVRYEQINAMLLNEFLKEHHKVEQQGRQIREANCKVQEQQVTINELKSTVAQQQEEMKVFAATLKDQASQIQKVSAQLEAGRPAPQTVLNNR